MLLLELSHLKLPLENPVMIFSLILFIILFAPLLFNKLKIPHLIGLILAGAIIGPNGFNLMQRNSSIILFGTVGLLYIMFLAGLEIDMVDFRKNSKKSVLFGLYTFAIPMMIGTAVGLYVLNFSLLSSILLASMFASHTLIAYPIISKLGVSKNRAVNIGIGGTMVTDTLALLVLAVVIGISSGELSGHFWIKLFLSVTAFGLVVSFTLPKIARWFFKRYSDNVTQYIFVLAMVFVSAFLAELAGLEAIIGAFLAGLALNRLIPHTSALMNRIEFVGNAFFIPFFLIGVGMLIDFKSFFKDTETIKVAVAMTVGAMFAKFIAAWITKKIFKFTLDEGRLIFGLINAHAAATLAVVLAGYNIILGHTPDGLPIRLLNDAVLNGSILMILVTCTVSTIVAQKGAQNIARSKTPEVIPVDKEERILIPVNRIESVDVLIDLGNTLKSKSNKQGMYALNVVEYDKPDTSTDKEGKKILQQAAVTAAAIDNRIQQLLRYDLNIFNGITSVIKENRISDLILAVDHAKGLTEKFLEEINNRILRKTKITTFLYKAVQPLATIKRHVAIIPEKAEEDAGFETWISKICNIGASTGAKVIFYSNVKTWLATRKILSKFSIDVEFIKFNEWDDFLIISREIKYDDNFVFIMNRNNSGIYQNFLQKLPGYLNKYFTGNSYLLICPAYDGGNGDSNIKKSLLEPLKGNLGKLDPRRLTTFFKKEN